MNSVGASVNYHLPVFAPFVALAACMAACVAATALAARTVFSVSPVEAMSAAGGDVDKPLSRPVVAVAAVGGLVGISVSWVLATSVPGRTAIIAGAVFGASGLLLCFALTGPLVRGVTALAGRFGAPGTLAAVNTARASRRVWATVMTVAVAIAVGMGTSGALQNLVSSLSASLQGLGEPAFYLSTSNRDGIPTGPSFGDDVAAIKAGDRVVTANANGALAVDTITPSVADTVLVDAEAVSVQEVDAVAAWLAQPGRKVVVAGDTDAKVLRRLVPGLDDAPGLGIVSTDSVVWTRYIKALTLRKTTTLRARAYQLGGVSATSSARR